MTFNPFFYTLVPMAKKRKQNAKQKQTRKTTIKEVRKTASRKTKKTNSSRTTKPKRIISKNPKSFLPKQKRKAAKNITTKIKTDTISKRRGKNIFDIKTKGRLVANKIKSIDNVKIRTPDGFVKGAFIIIKDRKGNVIGTAITQPEQFIDEKAVKQLIKNKLEAMQDDHQQWEDGEIVDDNPYADINPEGIAGIELKYF